VTDKEKSQQDQNQLNQQVVSKEVEALRTRLDKRKQLREVPESVETARNSVISCLRENDRRPLNCWKEIEAFKEEVRMLEKGWVDRIVR
jgi:MICOS complex subunit MIC19